MANYKMYRFYKGGKINPFDNENDTLSARFWEAEYVFDSSYFKKESSDLYAFFEGHDMGDGFIKLLSEKDRDSLSEEEKKPVFEYWLKYLFKYKYYEEYGGENKQEIAYYSTDF
jgi:hypothetical protein